MGFIHCGGDTRGGGPAGVLYRPRGGLGAPRPDGQKQSPVEDFMGVEETDGKMCSRNMLEEYC